MANINLIDDYLANRMNDAEKVAFEERLNSDSELRQEFNFHKDIVSSIKEARKADLKSMLNDIPVSSGVSTGLKTGLKLSVAVITAAILIGGFIYFMDGEEKSLDDKNNNVSEQVIPDSQDIEEEKHVIEELKEESIENVIEEKSVESKKEPTAKPEQKTSKPAEITTPNIVDFETDQEEAEITEPEVITEGGDYSTEQLFHSSIDVITDNSKKKYKFHYQFKDDKLYLFGDFDKELYQILEFNSKEGRTIFLYYKDTYYLLKENQSEITPLSEIEDQKLINKLNSLRQ